MKISKSLLQAIALGVAIGGTATSCSTLKEGNDLHLETCTEACDMDHTQERNDGEVPFDCPACGLG